MSGALANLALSKRSEILDKSSVNETLKDSLMKSPLTDNIFGLSLQKVQEEVSKAPQSVSVNVRLNDGKRTIASSSSGYQPTPTFSAKRRKVVRRKQYAKSSKTPHAQKSGSKGAQKSGPRPPRMLSTAQEGRELPLPSIPVGREVKSIILNSMGKENLRPMGSVDNSGGGGEGDQNFSSNSYHLCRSLPFSFQSLRILTNVYVCQRKCLFCCRRQQ